MKNKLETRELPMPLWFIVVVSACAPIVLIGAYLALGFAAFELMRAIGKYIILGVVGYIFIYFMFGTKNGRKK